MEFEFITHVAMHSCVVCCISINCLPVFTCADSISNQSVKKTRAFYIADLIAWLNFTIFISEPINYTKSIYEMFWEKRKSTWTADWLLEQYVYISFRGYIVESKLICPTYKFAKEFNTDFGANFSTRHAFSNGTRLQSEWGE